MNNYAAHAQCRHNQELFNTWTEKSAYLLGYLEADGTVIKTKSADRYRFCTSDKDAEYLQLLKEITSFTGTTSKIIHHVKEKEYHSCAFVVSSRTWKQVLRTQLRQDKIPDIPEELIHHYIRGYFDGDGSVYFDHGRTFVSFVFATEKLANAFLKEIEKNIGSSKGMKIYKKVNAECWYFRISKQELVAKFSSWLYNNAVIFLKRKEERFRKIARKVG